MKTKYGWLGSNGKILYVWQDNDCWGVTQEIKKASVFHYVDNCISHYYSKHAFPGDYLHDHLKFFDVNGQMVLF